jgi:phage baseplate assembly protein W
MADGKTYGIAFPFNISTEGKYLKLTQTANEEIRTDLIHLLLTRKGSRYFLPDFGTRLYEYIFEPLDSPTFNNIESEIREACEKYIPQLKITNISIKAATSEETDFVVTTAGNATDRQFTMPGLNPAEYTAKVRIDYTITNDVFCSKDFVILNI